MAKKKARRRQCPNEEFPKVHSAKAKAFLAAFRITGNITHAVKAAKVSRRSHSKWLENADYAKAFADAKAEADEALEMEARRRAVKGLRRYKFYKGEPVLHPVTGKPYVEHEYSDGLLIQLLKANLPDKYAERIKAENTEKTPEFIDPGFLAFADRIGDELKQQEEKKRGGSDPAT